MKASNFFAGIIMILAGLILFAAGPQLIIIPTAQSQISPLFRNEVFTVADIWERSVQLDEGVLVNGTVNVNSALTNEPSEISVLVLDDANYEKWVAHSGPTYVFQRDIANGQSFSFSAPRGGVYHLIFDNSDSPVKKEVTVSVDLQRQIIVGMPDDRVRYVAYVVFGVGALLTVIGVMRKTEVPWA